MQHAHEALATEEIGSRNPLLSDGERNDVATEEGAGRASPGVRRVASALSIGGNTGYVDRLSPNPLLSSGEESDLEFGAWTLG